METVEKKPIAETKTFKELKSSVELNIERLNVFTKKELYDFFAFFAKHYKIQDGWMGFWFNHYKNILKEYGINYEAAKKSQKTETDEQTKTESGLDIISYVNNNYKNYDLIVDNKYILVYAVHKTIGTYDYARVVMCVDITQLKLNNTQFKQACDELLNIAKDKYPNYQRFVTAFGTFNGSTFNITDKSYQNFKNQNIILT